MTDKQVTLGELEENVRAASDFLLEQLEAYEKAGGHASTFYELKAGCQNQRQRNILIEVAARAAIEDNERAQREAEERAKKRAKWEREQQLAIEERARAKEKRQNDYLAAGRRIIEQVKAAAAGGK